MFRQPTRQECVHISEVAPRDERVSFLETDRQQRTIFLNGHPHIEFNARVAHYPKRAGLSLPNPLKHDITQLLGLGNAGVKLELLGHGSLKMVLLRLFDLPYIQVYHISVDALMLHL